MGNDNAVQDVTGSFTLRVQDDASERPQDDTTKQDITGSFTLRVQDDASERPQDDTILSSLVYQRSGLSSDTTRRCGLRGPNRHCVRA